MDKEPSKEPNKRSVHTDALATLGTILGNNEHRDAIHIAVEPVEAGERMYPGNHIMIKDGKAYLTVPGKGMGIVDPFITTGRIEPGQKFWFLMYPRTVTSLRHVWSHPAFPDEVVVKKPTKSQSEQWLRDFCDNGYLPSYEEMMRAIENSNDGDRVHFGGVDAYGDIPDEFWDHAENVTGKKYPRAKHFSCSC